MSRSWARSDSIPIPPRERAPVGWLRRVVIGLAVGLLCLLSVAPSAAAHGGDETEEGYLLVQQALGHLAHDTSPTGIDLAIEKVDDALATQDQEGVAVAELARAKRALEAGQADRARALLQRSIRSALSNQAPAVGEETGTTVVVPGLPGREGLTGLDWVFLAGSVIALLAGTGLAIYFRPQDNIAELRKRLDRTRSAGLDAPDAPRVEVDPQ